jgi:predicted porin
MQKTIIAGCLALLGCAAHADVSIYGSLNASLESVKASGSGTSELPHMNRLNTGNSWLGFKGNEDLGNGLKAFWQIDSNLRSFEQGGVNDLAQSATFGTRNTFLCLQGRFGRFYMGFSDSAYKALDDYRLNPFVNTTGDMYGGIYNHGGARLANSMHYYLPQMNGFQAGATYAFDEARPTATNGLAQNNHRLSLAGRYDYQALTLGLAYDVQGSKLNAAKTDLDYNRRAFSRASASYQFTSGTTFGASFERDRKNNHGVPDTTQDSWLVALTQNFGRTNVSVVYSVQGKLQSAAVGQPDDYKASQWPLGAMYDLSKSTQLYAFATRINNHSRSADNFSGPLAWVFDRNAGTPTATLTPGNNPQSVGLGMRVFF